MPKRSSVAAGLLCRCLDGSEPLGEHLGRHGVGEPAVGEAGSALECRLGAATAPDRRSARLARRRRHLHVLEGVEAALVAHPLACPKLADDLDAFAKAGPALIERHAAAFVFLRKLAADADAEDEAPAGKVIERRDLLGDGRGMPQRQQEDRSAEGQAFADHSCLGDLRDGIEEGYGEGDVIAAPEGVRSPADPHAGPPSASSSSVGIHGPVAGSVRRNMVLTPTFKQLSRGRVICVAQIPC